jgi:hypothetical protein
LSLNRNDSNNNKFLQNQTAKFHSKLLQGFSLLDRFSQHTKLQLALLQSSLSNKHHLRSSQYNQDSKFHLDLLPSKLASSYLLD